MDADDDSVRFWQEVQQWWQQLEYERWAAELAKDEDYKRWLDELARQEQRERV